MQIKKKKLFNTIIFTELPEHFGKELMNFIDCLHFSDPSSLLTIIAHALKTSKLVTVNWTLEIS